MKRFLTYGITLFCAALLLPACSKDAASESGGGDTGTLEMHLTGTRTETGGYDPFDYLTIRIFSEKGLVREYTSLGDGNSLAVQLLKGEYRVAVEAGDRSAASFTHRTYEGEKEFSVAAGQTQNVEVPCKTINVISEVKFDASIAENFGSDFDVEVRASNTFDAADTAGGSVPSLTFTADGTGYFLLPEGAENLSWRFKGTHREKGAVETTGILEKVKAGGKYTLALRYSPSLPGYVDFTLTIDTNPDKHDDTIIFSPDPTIEGNGFDMQQVQRYAAGEKTFTISSMGVLQHVTLDFGDKTCDLLALSEPGVTITRPDDFSLNVTFGEAFFAALPAGDTRMRFRIGDADGGNLTADAVIRKQGVISTEYDPWGCSFTAKVVLFDAAGVKLAVRRTGGNWQEIAGTTDENDLCALRIAPEWTPSTNEGDLTVYTPAPGKGIFTLGTYEYMVTAGETEIVAGKFDTPAADTIENAGMDDWSTYTVTGSVATGGEVPYPNAAGNSFWVGGNNKTTNTLCTGNTEVAGHNGTACAQLKPVTAAGIFAAGNLFTGTFACGTGLLDMFGFASFGQPYTFSVRPTGMKVRYKATVSNVTNTGSGPLTTDDIDPARIFVCITDWTARHAVKSGKSFDESTFWDPMKTSRLKEGPILGYGNRTLTESTPDWVEEVIPIVWYDTEAAPSDGSFSLSISCVTSSFGDYVAGSTGNLLYVEDFEWVY